jgi:hypothetical protein
VFAFEENTSQRPFEEKLCQEFIRGVFARSRRASPPSAGMMKSSLSGISSMKSLALQKTIHLPSGENLAK